MFKRAWLSVKRKKTKSIILFLFLFIISNLVLSAISIKNATTESMNLAKKSLGGEVSLSMNMEKLRNNFMDNKEEPSIDDKKENMEKMHDKMDESNITKSDVDKLKNIKYVKDIKYTFSVDGEESSFKLYSNSTEEDGENKDFSKRDNMNNSLQIEAINTFKLQDDYVNKTIEFTEGEAFDEDDNDTVIISYELANSNNLSINDKIKVKDSSGNEHELTIIGIYQNTDSRGFNNYNKIYINTSTGEKFLSEDDYNNGNYKVSSAIFYLDNPENSDKFISKAKKLITDLDDRYLKLDIDKESYEQMVSSLEGVSKFSNTILIVVVLASIVVISLMVINSLKDRNYEIGVLLSLGEKKKKIVGQFIIELILISTIAFVLSIGSSSLISQKLADTVLESQDKVENKMNDSRQGGRGNDFSPFNMNKGKSNVKVIDEIDVNVNKEDIGLLFIVGYGIIFISMIVPSIKIINSDPKDILSRRE